MLLLIILPIVILAGILLQAVELLRFRTTEYQIITNKVHWEVRLVLLADLHGFSYGKENRRLLEAVRKAKPDVILIAGDLIVTGVPESYEVSESLCRELLKLSPVFFTFGNHETRAGDRNIDKMKELTSSLERMGVTLLNNEFSSEPVNEEELLIYGLEVPMNYYQKHVHNELPAGFLKERLGDCPKDRFSVLLSHNPAFSDECFAWGADLILSGHTHGGLIRFPGRGSLISPELTFFPKYDGGIYEKDGKHLIVSKGLGTHTFHIRIFDRAEVVSILLRPKT